MFKVLGLILGLERQSLKYSVNTVLTGIIYCVLLQVHGHLSLPASYFCGGVKQKPEIRQCSQATAEAASVTRKLYVLERFLRFLHQCDRAFVSRAPCLGLI